MESARVHYLQHVSFEGLGYIQTWLQYNGHTVRGTRFFEPAAELPPLENFDALIIMGGPMGVYDDQEYPWLRKEKAFIEDCVQNGKKVLGICLGAQLLAVCLGAFVHTAPNKEIGWFPVTTTDETAEVPWFQELFNHSPTVFHWHGDEFEIPYGSLRLLASQANQNQAFQYKPGVLGLQFHLETTLESLDQMLSNGQHELKEAPFVQNLAQIVEGRRAISRNNEMMAALLRNWLAS